MSLWSAQYTEPCGLRRYKGINEDGDAQYFPPESAAPLPFSARVDYTRKEVLDKDGNRVISELSLQTDLEINPLDVVVYDGQGYTALSSSPIRDVAGKIDHYEAAL